MAGNPNLPEWYAKIVDVVQAGLRSVAAKDESELIAKYDEHFQGQVSPANFRLYRKLRMRVADASGRRVKKFFLALNLRSPDTPWRGRTAKLFVNQRNAPPRRGGPTSASATP